MVAAWFSETSVSYGVTTPEDIDWRRNGAHFAENAKKTEIFM
jgi:hypothetical protein